MGDMIIVCRMAIVGDNNTIPPLETWKGGAGELEIHILNVSYVSSCDRLNNSWRQERLRVDNVLQIGPSAEVQVLPGD